MPSSKGQAAVLGCMTQVCTHHLCRRLQQGLEIAAGVNIDGRRGWRRGRGGWREHLIRLRRHRLHLGGSADPSLHDRMKIHGTAAGSEKCHTLVEVGGGGGGLGAACEGLLLSGSAGTGMGWKLLVGGPLPHEGRPGSLGSSNLGVLAFGASAGVVAAAAGA